jgi:hypothetical protein
MVLRIKGRSRWVIGLGLCRCMCLVFLRFVFVSLSFVFFWFVSCGYCGYSFGIHSILPSFCVYPMQFASRTLRCIQHTKTQMLIITNNPTDSLIYSHPPPPPTQTRNRDRDQNTPTHTNEQNASTVRKPELSPSSPSHNHFFF